MIINYNQLKKQNNQIDGIALNQLKNQWLKNRIKTVFNILDVQIARFDFQLQLRKIYNNFNLRLEYYLNGCFNQQALSYCYNYNVNQILISIKNTFIIMQTKTLSLQEECNQGLQEKQQFTYQALEQAQLIQNQQCNFLAFDYTSTQILASFGTILKAYLFINEQLIFISIFQITNSRVTCIENLKQCNLFIFAMLNGQIQISSSVGMNQGKYIQKLRDHVSPIYHLQSNKNSDSIISCDDWKVSFFIKQSQAQYSYSYTNNIRICAVSFNEIGDKLIISDYNKDIIALVKRGTGWIKLQNFHLGKLGHGISFIGNDSFMVQEAFKTLGYYKFVNQGQEFKRQRELKIQSYGNWGSRKFNQRYIKIKQILINKDGISLNFMKIQDDPYFVTEFQLQFHDSSTQVALNENGSYLVTWDNFTQSIKIYKYFD
ncbi:unnamed protein product [Paramecium octaurelia]|uniref:Uncharacterized protein n=1 Tax=Paramecium octaurelia TaxID=43137 RepID=A0A8S1XS89_PAROT|nr:unnamed protein product [Paramecium octaurelia]